MTLIPYHANLKYSMRPNNFRLAPDHVLNTGCQFMGGGALAGSEKYFDSSVFGSRGTITEATWGDALGRNTLTFDGSNDVVSVQNANVDMYPCVTMSVACWVWIDPTSAGNDVVVCSEFVSQGWSFEVYNGSPRWEIYGQEIDVGASIATSEWHHVVFNWVNATRTAELFLDGVSQGTGTTPSAFINNSKPFLYIGLNGEGSNFPFPGKVTDVCLWKRLLSLPEIQQLASPDPMLGGWIQPINTTTYSFPISTGPPPTRKSNIFKSRVIRGIAC